MLRYSPAGLREFVNRLPTADLYFLNPLTELARTGSSHPAPRHISGNAYLVGGTGVIVRYGSGDDIAALKRDGARRIVYVADDDFVAGASDPGLPDRYREKLRRFAQSDWPILKREADSVIVPGSVLAEVYGAKALVVPPAWRHPPASPAHFGAGPVEIACLGTGSHGGDLELLAALLAQILKKHPNTRLTLFAGGAPESLGAHPRVRSLRPLAWWRYKRALPRMRFHLALYPLAPTAFNRARSANKLYEHAIVGAASLMSPNPALQAAAGSALNDIFVGDDLDEWRARIESSVTDPGALCDRADAVRAHIVAQNPLARAAEAWRKILATDV
jgi:hypothetical protein